MFIDFQERRLITITMDDLRRPAVFDDAVRYQLFLVTPDSSKTHTHDTEYLQQLVQKILAEFAPLLVQYIWQHEPFNINYYPEKGEPANLIFANWFSLLSGQ